MTSQLHDKALRYLRNALNNPNANFRDGQWEAISDLVQNRSRLLVVQRTGWGQLVKQGKYETNHFDDQLVEAMAEMIQRWNPEPKPTWITCIPSLNRPHLVPNFAQKLANRLQIPFIPVVSKIKN
ncbi:hypothetical protein VB715_03950 [Crocosphaera sp. UHCC 0190]|uniref:hypothetical protein n=1 Tax=Crocosphaera sp. UHCC 0190 TaxID=3110246 RepID=UPI002B211881|nr:hypothetical protein [Crocosphaera sp. UHCC 0190]MEA5508909.1 hypothetical protein [Crocosphaera sp. UHCC 0190]